MSEREWRDLPYWQRVNRRALGFIAVTGGLMIILFLPIILGVLGDMLFGDGGALAGILLGLVGWLWASAMLIESLR